jgi:hypothetical protein
MSEEERVIIRLAADNKALRDLVDWQAAENKRLRDALWLIENDAHDLEDAVRIARAVLEGK